MSALDTALLTLPLVFPDFGKNRQPCQTPRATDPKASRPPANSWTALKKFKLGGHDKETDLSQLQDLHSLGQINSKADCLGT